MRATTSLSLEELRSTLHSVLCATGFSVTVAPFGGMEMSNFEIAPSGATEKSISGYDYHFNMWVYRCTGIVQCMIHAFKMRI